MATQAGIAKKLREIANALESGLVTPRIRQEVETFISEFPMAEVLTCPEDKLSKCPTEILEEIFQYNRLEVLFWSTRRCVMLERDQSSGTSPW